MRISLKTSWRAPRYLLACPADFGQRPSPIWLESAYEFPGVLAQSHFQHRWALAVKEELLVADLTVLDLVESVPSAADQLQRKLRGQRWAGLDEILSVALRLGVHVLPVHDRSIDLLPAR